MSYEIIYARQFIRTTRGIIPLLLSGSNNCSMLYHGREIRERDWGVPFSDDWLECPEAVMLKDAAARFGGDDCQDEQFAVIGSKWVTCGEFLQYIRNGVRRAMTIEEICRLKPDQYLSCMVSYCDKSVDSRWEQELFQSIRATAELESWIDAARKKKRELIGAGTNSCVSICISLQGIHSLGIERTTNSKDPTGAVLAKRGKYYITKFEENRISLSENIGMAMEFESVEAARDALPALFRPYRFVSARNKAKDAQKHCVLRVTEGDYAGYYISHLYSRSIQCIAEAGNAKRFLSESAAVKWYAEHIGRARFPSVKAAEAVRLDEPIIGCGKSAS